MAQRTINEVGSTDVPVSVIQMFLKTGAYFHLGISSPNGSYTSEDIKR